MLLQLLISDLTDVTTIINIDLTDVPTIINIESYGCYYNY